MNITFKITSLPKDQEKYRLISDTEGSIEIEHNGDILFFYNEILLAEFARILKQWLIIRKNTDTINMIYNSMDIEEEPVLLFRPDTDDSFFVESAIYDVPKHDSISGHEIAGTLNKYIDTLDQELKSRLGDISSFTWL